MYHLGLDDSFKPISPKIDISKVDVLPPYIQEIKAIEPLNPTKCAAPKCISNGTSVVHNSSLTKSNGSKSTSASDR